MNKAYKSVYNEQTGTFVAVAENVNARGKKSSSARRVRNAIATAGAGMLIAGTSFSALADDDEIIFKANDGTTSIVKIGQTLGILGGSNITTTASEDDEENKAITIALNDNLDLGNSGSLKIGDTTVNKDGLTINGGPSVTNTGIDAGDRKITNVADGTENDHAVNLGQLKEVDETANKGWQLAAGSETNSHQIKPGDTATFKAGKNLEVSRENGTITYRTADDVEFSNIKITGDSGKIEEDNKHAVTGGAVYDALNVQGAGIKYFRANSDADDAEATGEESIAIGPEAEASGDSSFAAGDGAIAENTSSIAIGDGAKAQNADGAVDQENTIAIGTDSESGGAGSTAIGHQATAGGSDSIAFGTSTGAAGTSSVALGHSASASGGNAIALGSTANASGLHGLAFGSGAAALAEDNISIGRAAGQGTVAGGDNDKKQNIAIGATSGQNVEGYANTAIGFGAGTGVNALETGTNPNHNIALGTFSGTDVAGQDNISIGRNANQGMQGDTSIAIGTNSKADSLGLAIGSKSVSGNKGIALGSESNSSGRGVAIGSSAVAESGFIALGSGSKANEADLAGPSWDDSTVTVQGLTGYLTNQSAPSYVLSVGNKDSGNGSSLRRITNVADGANDSDAATVAQLKKIVDGVSLTNPLSPGAQVIQELQEEIARNTQHYVSIRDGGAHQDNRSNDGALALNSMAIGIDAETSVGATNSLAIGSELSAQGASAIAIGHKVEGIGLNSTTIGNSETKAQKQSGIAIGTNVISSDVNSIVIGRDSSDDLQGAVGETTENSIVIGTSSKSRAVEGIVLGHNSSVIAERGIAQGSNTKTEGDDAMAFGTNAVASGTSSIAQGHGANTLGKNSIAQGTNAKALAESSQASGTGAIAHAERGIAMGQGARSGQADPQPEDIEHNRDSIAIGSEATAEMNSSTALGRDASATANFAQAFGEQANASAVESIAQGKGAIANETQAIAMGSDAKAQHEGSVALGAGSETAEAVGTPKAELNGLKFGNFAGDDPNATVSVGKTGEERTITNVAAGRINADSTDAINGSQLFATNTVLGNVANSTKNSIGGKTSLGDDGTITTENVGGTGEDTIHDAIGYAAQGWQLAAGDETGSHQIKPGDTATFDAGKNLEVSRENGTTTYKTADDVEFDNVDVTEELTVAGNTTINEDGISTNSVTTTELDAGDGALTVNEGSFVIGGNTTIDMGGNQVTNVAAGTENDHAVNLGQLKDVDETANKGWQLAAGDETGSHQIKPGDTATFDAGKNLEVSRDDGTITYKTADDVEFDNVDVAEELTVAGNTTINEDGISTNSVTTTELDAGDGALTVNEGSFVIGGNTTIDMGGNQITNVAAGTENDHAVNLGQLKDVYETANKGWQLAAGDETGSHQIKPGDTATFKAGKNLEVSRDDGTITYKTADDVEFDNVDVAEELTVAGNTTIDEDGISTNSVTTTELDAGDGALTVNEGSFVIGGNTTIDMGGNQVTNVAAGTENDHAVNLGQLNEGLAAAKTEVEAGKNITVTESSQDPSVYVVATEDDVEFDSVTSKDDDGNKTVLDKTGVAITDEDGNETSVNAGNIAVSGDGNTLVLNAAEGTLTGLTNRDWSDPTFGTVGRAATEEQLKPIGDFLGFKDGNYTFNYNGEDHDSLASALDSIHWNVEAPEADNGGNGGDAGSGNDGSGSGTGGTTTTPIHNTNTVGFAGDENIFVTKTERFDDDDNLVGADIQMRLAQDLNVNSVTANTVNAGNVVTDSVEINNGPIINENGIDMRETKITNLAAGTERGDAVNLGQLQDTAGNLQNQINDVRGDMHRMDKRNRAGIAAAMATAGLPQAYLPGKSMMAMAGATWRGESGLAIGVSTISDNGHWVVKLSGTSSSRGDFGGTVGVGYQW